MRFRTRVAIQAPVEVRDPAGGVSHTWETVPALASVIATPVIGIPWTLPKRFAPRCFPVIGSVCVGRYAKHGLVGAAPPARSRLLIASVV